MTGFLIFARCAGFIFRAPGFSHPSVPPPLRAGFAVLFTLAIAPGSGVRARGLDGAAFVAALLVEFVLGSAIGMAASLAYDGAYAGGRAVDDYVGVKAIAPSVQLVAPSGFGRLWSLAFTGGLFLTGAYRPILIAFAASFDRLPVGSAPQFEGWASFAAGYVAALVIVALQVAAPAIGLAFAVQIAIGALSRAVPRFGSFMLAFPLAFAAALIETSIAVPLLSAQQLYPAIALPHAVR